MSNNYVQVFEELFEANTVLEDPIEFRDLNKKKEIEEFIRSKEQSIIDKIKTKISDDEFIEELRTNFLELEGAYSKDSTYWTEVNYKMGGIAGLNLLRTMQKYREKSKNESIYRTLYDNYTSDILCIIEDEILKQCEEYKIANKKYCDFLMENPRIEDFLDNGKIENITPKEVYKIFELMQIINEIDEIRFKEGVRLGIKEGNLS